MQETPNLKLKKPDLTDYVNVGDLNENADIIDEAIQENKDDLTTHLAERALLNKLGHVKAETDVEGNLVLNKDKVGLDKVENKSSEDIRTDSTTILRTEVISSLPQTALKGQIVLHDEVGNPKFKGYDGGKWV